MEDLDIRVNRIAVVGAGWAGLAAAVELAAAGWEVDLFDAARHAGGRARSVVIDGRKIDNGQHILLGAYRETLRLIRLTGGDESRLLERIPLELAYPGLFALRAVRWLPAPLHLLGGLLLASGLAAGEKLSAVRFMVALVWQGFKVCPDLTVTALLGEHRQSERVRRFLWEPLCVAALNTDPAQASAQVFATVLADAFMGKRSDSDLLIPKTHLDALFPDLACAYLKTRLATLHFGTPVLGLGRTTHGVRLATSAGEHEYQQVICALPPNRTRAIIQGIGDDDGFLNMLDAFDYEPIATCYLQYPDHVALERPMIGLPGPIGQWAFDRGALGGSRGLLAVVISAAAHLRGIEADQLALLIDREMRALVPDLPSADWHRVITEKRATFRCSPGRKRPGVHSPIVGIFLAGDHTVDGYPATLESAVRSGVNAAHAAINAARGPTGR